MVFQTLDIAPSELMMVLRVNCSAYYSIQYFQEPDYAYAGILRLALNGGQN